ncbi:hypothetical protein [Pseudomonas citronellolis]|uniref:hypothetical protein n=1 Tax=Pseudomonas citronellolis TaxID=53408 RepID=UPI0023E46B82|nr:hypothetical protein [Pseudomonas citronellolis]MDF3935572.1 hypothetical protein [Pseudomonas citronellolis]
MNRRWLLGLAMLALAGFAGADDTGWEAHVELRGLGAEPAALPPVLVPKQSVLLKVSVWMPDGVNWYPRYPHWDMPGATLLPLMMLTPSIEREHGGATQRGATQNYLLTPLAEGALRLSPDAIEVDPDQPDSPLLPIEAPILQVALPAGAGSLQAFLPATALKLSQRFYLQSGDEPPHELAAEALGHLRLRAGQLLERRLTVEALGVQGNQIPALAVDADAVQHQAEVTDLNDYGDFTGGRRTEHWFYAPGARSSLDLQALDIRWYELGSHQFRTAHLAGAKVQADALRETDARLRLSWWERLTLLPGRTLLALPLAAALLGLAVVYRRRLTLHLGRWWGTARRRIGGAEPWLFLRFCVRLGALGPASPSAWRAGQRWLRCNGADESLERYTALQAWGRARYAAEPAEPPGRLALLADLIRLRRQRGGESPGVRRRHELPVLQDHQR